MCDDNTTMKKASEYWGALTNEGVIYLMESGITRVSYITFLFICPVSYTHLTLPTKA